MSASHTVCYDPVKDDFGRLIDEKLAEIWAKDVTFGADHLNGGTLLGCYERRLVFSSSRYGRRQILIRFVRRSHLFLVSTSFSIKRQPITERNVKDIEETFCISYEKSQLLMDRKQTLKR